MGEQAFKAMVEEVELLEPTTTEENDEWSTNQTFG